MPDKNKFSTNKYQPIKKQQKRLKVETLSLLIENKILYYPKKG